MLWKKSSIKSPVVNQDKIEQALVQVLNVDSEQITVTAAEAVQVAPTVESSATSVQKHVKSPPVDTEESRLVEQAKKDPATFGVLYERYVDRIYAYIYHRVGNAQDSEDLTARTFYRALEKLHTYEDRGLPFSAWLFRIAHNLVANWHRDRGRRRFLSFDKLWSYSQDQELPEKWVEQEETNQALWEAIERLPTDRKDLLLYKFGSHLSNLEIGQMMDKSEGAIKSLYFRTLAALRKDMESRGW